MKNKLDGLIATKSILLISILLSFFVSEKAFSNLDIGPRKKLFSVHSIEIRGTKKVEKEAILEKISTQVGMVADNYLIKRDIEKIYSMKFFEYVEAHTRVRKGKNILQFVVKEKPIISKIVFEGN